MLLGNGQLYNKVPMCLLGDRWCSFVRDEVVINQANSEGFTKLSSYPDGYDPHHSLIPPRKAGGMRGTPYTIFGLTDSGTIVGGVTDVGLATIGIDTNTPDGQLVSTVPAGGAPSAFDISTNTPQLTASIGGIGSGDFGFDTNTPILGAEASLIGDGPFGIEGTLTSYAIGIMEGTTADTGVTVDNIVTALEAAVLPVNIVEVNSYTVTGTGQLGNEWGP